VEQLAAENAGRLKVAKVNVDDSPTLAEQYGAMSIPLFIVFKDGVEAHRQLGAVPKGVLQQMIDRHK
jgi:thioredoxin 1